MEENLTFEKPGQAQGNGRVSPLALLFMDICDFFGITGPDPKSNEWDSLLAIPA
jgi:hypothetical protein